MSLNRRHFLQLAGTALGSSLISLGDMGWALAEPQAPALATGNEKRLIVLFLRGAVDGLNVVVPYGDPEYAPLRPTLALGKPGTANGVLDLDGHFGLHPALAPLMPLWQQKRLAFVHASGSPNSSRSHFEAQDFMETATPGIRTTPDGWMNRLIAGLPAPHGPTQAINLAGTQPHIFAGRLPTSTVSLTDGVGKPHPADRPAVAKAFASLYSGTDALSQAYQQGQMANQDIAADLTPAMQAEQDAANHGAPSPKGFPAVATRLGALLARDARIRLVFSDLGGWDTHVNQGAATGQLADRLAPLGQGLAALTESLGPTLDKTMIVVLSEFGRTARENGNKGTDHGHGNVMWLIGGKVAGGVVHGQWPGLAPDKLNENRDLAITTDFRTVLATVLKDHMGLSPTAIAHTLPPSPPFAGPMKGLIAV